MSKRLKRVLIGGGIVLLVLLVACGLGGKWIYSSLMASASRLDVEERQAEENGIFVAESSEPFPAPAENAAICYIQMTEPWLAARDQITEERFSSYMAGRAGDDEIAVERTYRDLMALAAEAVTRPECRWSLDYPDSYLTEFPFLSAVRVAAILRLRSALADRSPGGPLAAAEDVCRMAEHLAKIEDIGASYVAAQLNQSVDDYLATQLLQDRANAPEILAILERHPSVDPRPAWRGMARRQYQFWSEFEKQPEAIRKPFEDVPRDQEVMVNASLAQILHLWNGALANPQESIGRACIRLERQIEDLDKATSPATLVIKRMFAHPSMSPESRSLAYVREAEGRGMLMEACRVIVHIAEGGTPESHVPVGKSTLTGEPYKIVATDRGFTVASPGPKEDSIPPLLERSSVVLRIE